MITRRSALAALGAAPFVQTRRRDSRKTNVVMFMTDDHGAWATSIYGCKEMHTPTMERLGAGGVRFSRAFACTPVCSPTRMTYMTGTLPSTHGVQDWLLPEDSFGPASPRWLDGQTTYSEILKRNGYTLGMCGKWHMGQDDTAQAGFTYWSSVPGGSGPYRHAEFVHNGKKERSEKFKTDSVGDYAIDFLNQQKNGNPFCLLVPFYASHTPYDYQPDTYRHWYDHSDLSCFPNTPVSPWQNPSLKQMFGKREPKHAYSALVTGADANMGRIIERLEQLDLREDTLIVFTSDQGWNAGHHGVWGKGNGTIPFNMYEQSLQTPLVWNHPGRIPGGKMIDPLVSSYDYFPTILEYLGIDAPKDPKRVGRSYAEFLRGGSPQWRSRLYFEYCYTRGIRTENLKYIERGEGYPSEMYDLEADPGETKNVLDNPSYRKQRNSFHTELTSYFHDHGAPPIDEWKTTTKQHLPPDSHPPEPSAPAH